MEALPVWRYPRDSGSSSPHPPTDVLPVSITLAGSRGKNRDNPHSDAIAPARPSTTSLSGQNLPERHDSTARRDTQPTHWRHRPWRKRANPVLPAHTGWRSRSIMGRRSNWAGSQVVATASTSTTATTGASVLHGRAARKTRIPPPENTADPAALRMVAISPNRMPVMA